MKIEKIMSRSASPIDPATLIVTAAQKMRDEGVGCLLVGRKDELCGIVTDRDVVIRACAQGRSAHQDPISSIMSSVLVWCFEDQPVEEAERLMVKHGVRQLPVLDRDGVLSGLVSLSDVRGDEVERTHKKPWLVTFYRKITDGRGWVRKAPLMNVYIAKLDCKVKAAAAARKIFESGCHGARWKGVADGYRIRRELDGDPSTVRGGQRAGHLEHHALEDGATDADARATRATGDGVAPQ